MRSRASGGNGVAERFIRMRKEQLLWVRTFQTLEDLCLALHNWLRLYNEQWLVEQRHGFHPQAASRARRIWV
jgi:putative transposase